MKKITLLVLCFLVSVIIVFSGSYFKKDDAISVVSAKQESVIHQDVLGFSEHPLNITKIYHKNDLLGVVSDKESINRLLEDTYNEKYAEDFPDTNMALGEDVYMVEELDYRIYENIDELITAYLKGNDLFSIKTNRIDFSEKGNIYATIYVKNMDDFNAAQNEFLLNFVSQDTLNLLKANQAIPELTTYGRRDLGVYILENITASKAYANPSSIMTDKEEIFDWLCYGDNEEREYYTVKNGDTIQGVASFTKDYLSAQQLVNINHDVLFNENQVLEEGMVLNTTYFTSPINVVVEKELIVKEVVYPEKTEYREDSSMREGSSYIFQSEKEGSQNTKYKEKWINGVMVSYDKISSALVEKPQQEIVYIGTKVIPGVGSGRFRWPVDNPRITCGWYCYPGHTAIDMVNNYNRYGNIYAADRGTIVRKGYGSLSGNFVVIDHNNGLQTQYNHMSSPAYFNVGQNVDKGEVIGQIGATGYTTGPHLHFVIMEDYTRVNPCKYMGC